ncbi:MAG: flavin reductase family protein [Candidatus Tantalella remota]|nr:flavin reductase family protein [Candidatus Tantalella remota]
MSEMIKIEKMVLDPVLPLSVIGSKTDGQVNFMAASWFTRLEVDPYLFGVSVQQKHFTYKAIMNTRAFSINIPADTMVQQADAVGQLSGNDYDKSETFEAFYGDNENAPMAKGSVVSMECELVNIVDITKRDAEHPNAHTLFIGEVKNVWANEEALDENGLNTGKISPVLWTWSPMNYWTLGEKTGRAWDPENQKLIKKKK